MKYLKRFGELLWNSINGFIDDNALKFSASLAYYTIFSLPPLLIVIISITGIFYGQKTVQGTVYSHISEFVGRDITMQIEEMINDVRLKGNTPLSSIIGIVVLLIGATGVFTEIQDSINMIWGVKAKPKKGLIKIIVNRVVSFSMIIGIGFILLVSLMINTMMIILSKKMSIYFPALTLDLIYLFNSLFTFFVILFLFAIIFKFLPDVIIQWKDVIVGAFITAVFFIIGKSAIGFYLSHADFATANDAAGSIVVLLVWIYYSSFILFFGAEFTKIYSQLYGRKIKPTEYAILVEIKEIEKTNE